MGLMVVAKGVVHQFPMQFEVKVHACCPVKIFLVSAGYIIDCGTLDALIVFFILVSSLSIQ